MSIFIISWPLFILTFGLMLLFYFIMAAQSSHFYTKDGVEKKFSIIELEFPASPVELVKLIRGLYRLPVKQEAIRSVTALRKQLYTDFLFMPFAYGSIFILCMLVSAKMQSSFGFEVFYVFAWAQIIPWLCDITENIYLLRKMKPHPPVSSDALHKAYLLMECVKWGISLGAAICAVAAICYFWLAGHYHVHSLNYLAIIAGEIIVFALMGKVFFKKKKQEKML